MPVGITQPIYLNGYVFNFPQKSVLPVPVFGETVRRVRDGTLIDHTHRAAITDPDVSSKFRFEIEWEDLSDGDVIMWNRCVAQRGPFTFCPWMMWAESFTFLTGESLAGTLQRGSAKDEIDAVLIAGTPATDFDATFQLDDVTSTDFAIGAYAAGRSAWATTTAAVGPGVVLVSYAPLFIVRVTDQTPVLYGSRQGGRLVLEEY